MSKNDMLFRELSLDRKGVNEESRTIPASLSSEIEVERWFGREVLVHDAGAINLSRAAEGLPLLFGHDHRQPIGLAENVRVEDGRLRADLRFSENQKASEVWRDVQQGFLKNISIGYRVHKWEESDSSELRRVTNWELFEASVVTVPADASVGINRAETEENRMSDSTDTRTAGNEAGQGAGENITDFQVALDQTRLQEQREGMRLEAARRDGISGVFNMFTLPDASGNVREDVATINDLMNTVIRNGNTVEQAREALLRYLGSTTAPTAVPMSDDARRASTRITGGEDVSDKFARGAELAILVRAGLETDPDKVREARGGELYSMPLLDLGRRHMQINNRSTGGMNRQTLAGAVLTRSPGMGHSTGDFPAILENVVNKAMLMGWSTAAETWSQWCKVGSISDFKEASRVGMSEYSDLLVVPEGGEFKHGTVADRKESFSLVTYGRKLTITRQAIINDDLNAFTSVPSKMGEAAARIPGDLAYAILTSNPTLNQDSTDLFHADHSNFVASGSGGAPTAATVDAGRVAMGKQKDQAGQRSLGIRPSYLLVPLELQTTADVLMAAADNPDTTGDRSPNPVRGIMEVVPEHRLSDALATGWYMAARGDTVEVAFLDGQREPYLESKQGWDVDGVEWKVRLDVGACALDFRGLYFNYGA